MAPWYGLVVRARCGLIEVIAIFVNPLRQDSFVSNRASGATRGAADRWLVAAALAGVEVGVDRLGFVAVGGRTMLPPRASINDRNETQKLQGVRASCDECFEMSARAGLVAKNVRGVHVPQGRRSRSTIRASAPL